MISFVRVDRIEPSMAESWYGWAVFNGDGGEFSRPFKFRLEPAESDVEAEALAYEVAMNRLAAEALSSEAE